MENNEMKPTQEVQYVPSFIVPTDPITLISINKALEIVKASKLRIASEKTLQSETIKKLSEDTLLPISILKKFAALDENSIDEQIMRLGDLEALDVAVKRALAVRAWKNGSSSVKPENMTQEEESDTVIAPVAKFDEFEKLMTQE
jgi:hypothetical protein